MFNNQLSNRFEDLLETENPITKQKYTPEDRGYSAVHIESGPEHI